MNLRDVIAVYARTPSEEMRVKEEAMILFWKMEPDSLPAKEWARLAGEAGELANLHRKLTPGHFNGFLLLENVFKTRAMDL